MIKFKLFDENEDMKEYVINLNFETDDDFLEWSDSDDDFQEFMDDMETGDEDWCGVHDYVGEEDEDGNMCVGYSSYEITDFEKAIEKWKSFFKKKGKLGK